MPRSYLSPRVEQIERRKAEIRAQVYQAFEPAADYHPVTRPRGLLIAAAFFLVISIAALSGSIYCRIGNACGAYDAGYSDALK